MWEGIRTTISRSEGRLPQIYISLAELTKKKATIFFEDTGDPRITSDIQVRTLKTSARFRCQTYGIELCWVALKRAELGKRITN